MSIGSSFLGGCNLEANNPARYQKASGIGSGELALTFAGCLVSRQLCRCVDFAKQFNQFLIYGLSKRRDALANFIESLSGI